MPQVDESPSKSGPASRLRNSATTRPIQPRPAHLTVTTPQSSRPSSRVIRPASPVSSSPKKTSLASHRASSRPLWNTGRANCGLALGIPKPTPSRPSKARTIAKIDRPSDASFANTTFVSAASGFDENRRPASPSKSTFRDLKSPPSILSGLGFGKKTHQHASLAHPGLELKGSGGSPNKTGVGERTILGYDPSKEPIKAFLRIRPPNLSTTPRSPYITILSDTDVLLTQPPPSQPVSNPTTHASQDLHSGGGAKYKFTKVYGPEATQKDFFQGTALPLVGDLLLGKSSLCFAYGVTASGKTYTVQGGLDKNINGGSMDPGLLPRTMDVLFNSIGDSQTDLRIRPTRLTGVEVAPLVSSELAGLAAHQRSSLSDDRSVQERVLLKDDTVLPIDQASEYGVWISYAEVYNEKIYDLLDSPAAVMGSASSGATLQSFTANITDQVTKYAQMLHTKASISGGVIKRKALVLKHDKAHGHKYVHGLTELRVRTADDAKLLLRHGQINRTVFSTLANRTSSRSHGIFTIKVIQVPKFLSSGASTGSGSTEEEILSHARVSRLSIVDLAGSERTRNTQTTGDRLKEAGNINKSLMVLGQCMETLRRNQESVKQGVVPFRHSKITELFQSFFTGKGRTVMIVNVNPCDTGFEENSHVMKFSAVASEVATVREHVRMSQVNRVTPTAAAATSAQEEALVKDCSLIVEDEEEEDAEHGESEESEADDGFVNHLLEQLSMMRVKLVEAEIRAAMIEAEVRDQVMQEYQQKMVEMEELFVKNLAFEAQEAELKTDMKIDIFNRATQQRQKQSNEYQQDDDDISDEGLVDIDHGIFGEQQQQQDEAEPESPTPRRAGEPDTDNGMTSLYDQPRRKLRSQVA